MPQPLKKRKKERKKKEKDTFIYKSKPKQLLVKQNIEEKIKAHENPNRITRTFYIKAFTISAFEVKTLKT